MLKNSHTNDAIIRSRLAGAAVGIAVAAVAAFGAAPAYATHTTEHEVEELKGGVNAVKDGLASLEQRVWDCEHGDELTCPGVKGDTGDTGPQGDIGPKGDQGDQGIQGLKGDKGDQGIQGLKGDKGDQGIQGLKGDQGDQGLQGLKGDQGDQGIQGFKGDKGAKGDTGLTGAKGGTGLTGATGDKGDKGDIGLTGANSTVPGPDGPVGPEGPEGPAGPAGSVFDTTGCVKGMVVTFTGSGLECDFAPVDSLRAVFVTSQSFTGDLQAAGAGVDGLNGADNLCQDAAEADGSIVPPGSYVAWLSTSTVDARDRLAPNKVGYQRGDGDTVANSKDDLLDGELDVPIFYDEFGNQVFSQICNEGTCVLTGTFSDGTLSDPDATCSDWTSAASSDQWNLGAANAFGVRWTSFAEEFPDQPNTIDCNRPGRLYCIQN